MSYGGVYNPGPDGTYRDSESNAEGSDYSYDYTYEDDGEGRSHNYLQGYDYNHDPYLGHFNAREGGGGHAYSQDYQDFQNYEPYRYYADLHARGDEAYSGYGHRNDNDDF